MTDDPYDRLNVDREASPGDIKAAYRRKAKAQHPDAGGDAQDFALLSRAWAVLRDPTKRAEYDRTGKVRNTCDLHKEAVSNLAALLDILVEKLGTKLNKTNLIIAMQTNVHRAVEKLETDERKAKTISRRLDKAIKKMHRLSEGVNILSRVLEDKKRLAESTLDQARHEKEVAGVMLEMLDDYRFDADPQDQGAGFGLYTLGSATMAWST